MSRAEGHAARDLLGVVERHLAVVAAVHDERRRADLAQELGGRERRHRAVPDALQMALVDALRARAQAEPAGRNCG